MTTGQWTPIQIHIHAWRAICAPQTFRFNLFLSVVDISDPSFLRKILFTASTPSVRPSTIVYFISFIRLFAGWLARSRSRPFQHIESFALSSLCIIHVVSVWISTVFPDFELLSGGHFQPIPCVKMILPTKCKLKWTKGVKKTRSKKIDFTQTTESPYLSLSHKIFIKYANVWMHGVHITPSHHLTVICGSLHFLCSIEKYEMTNTKFNSIQLHWLEYIFLAVASSCICISIISWR